MPFLLLVAISLLVRLPLWVNPDGLNSDHAVAALQGLHMLRGEFSWFLWGVGYQASLESLIIAGFFRLLGENSYAVLATTYLAYLILLWAIHAILRRYLPIGKATLAALFVVIAAPPLLFGTFYPPRLWSLTAIFVGLYAAERGRYGWAAFLAFASLYIDFFAIQFWPALLAFSATRAWLSTNRREALKHFIVGFALGAVVLGLSRKLGPQGGTHLGIKFHYVGKNLRLIFEGLLPVLYAIPPWHAYQEISVPSWFRDPVVLLIRTLAGALPLAAVALSLRRMRDWDRDTKMWFGFGVVLCATSFTGTMLSADLHDIHASRYLTPLVWALPFLLLPTIKRETLRDLAVFFAPYFTVALLTSQYFYGPAVRNVFVPVKSAFGQGTNEKELGALLAREKVHYGYSNYWPSYRITYLLRESLIVVPIEPIANRYEPYRQAVEKADRYAVVFTEAEDEPYRAHEAKLKAEGKTYQLFDVTGYQGFIVRR